MDPALHRHTLADTLRRSAARHPDKPAIVCGDTRWSYAEFHAVVERVAAGCRQTAWSGRAHRDPGA